MSESNGVEIERPYRERRDADLGDLVAEYLDRLNDGERLTADQVLAQHPEIGQEIVEELRFFVQLETVGGQKVAAVGTLGDYTLRRDVVNANLIRLTRHFLGY